jgi:hypothetical protein
LRRFGNKDLGMQGTTRNAAPPFTRDRRFHNGPKQQMGINDDQVVRDSSEPYSLQRIAVNLVRFEVHRRANSTIQEQLQNLANSLVDTFQKLQIKGIFQSLKTSWGGTKTPHFDIGAIAFGQLECKPRCLVIRGKVIASKKDTADHHLQSIDPQSLAELLACALMGINSHKLERSWPMWRIS